MTSAINTHIANGDIGKMQNNTFKLFMLQDLLGAHIQQYVCINVKISK